MNAPVRINPYLTGNFAPVRSEDDFKDLPVKGEIPRDLAGCLYRNGPNPQFSPRDPNHHWFAGDGMLFVGAGYGSFGQQAGNVLVAFRPKK